MLSFFPNALEIDGHQRDSIRCQNLQIQGEQITLFYHCPFIRHQQIIVSSHYCSHCLLQVQPHSAITLTCGRQNTDRHTFSAGSGRVSRVLFLLFFYWEKIPILDSDSCYPDLLVQYLNSWLPTSFLLTHFPSLGLHFVLLPLFFLPMVQPNSQH